MNRNIFPVALIVSLACGGIFLSSCDHGEPTVAQVGGESIKASDLKARLMNLPASAHRDDGATRHHVLDALIREKLIAAFAKKEGLDSKDYIGRLMSHELAVSDHEIATYYHAHEKEFPGKSLSQAKEYVRAILQKQKADIWVEQAKTTIPTKIDEAAVASIDLSK